MSLAIGLYRWSDAWLMAKMAAVRGEPYMGPSPGFTLLVLLNAPLAFLRAFYTRHLPEVWDRAVLILAIGLFWYWIALNIEKFPLKRTVTTFALPTLRVTSDLVVMAVAGLVGISDVSRAWWWLPRMDVPDPQGLWMLGSHLCLLTWSFVLLFFFGRDLVLLAIRRSAQ
jgi:hypothetical protein